MAKDEQKDFSLDDFYEEDILGNFEEEEEEEDSDDESEQEEEEEESSDSNEDTEEEQEDDETNDDAEAESDDEDDDSSDKDKGDESEDEDEKDLDPLTFWSDVDKINGTEVEVEYGDVDPISPQGAALREQAVAEAAVETFLESMKTQLPKAYQAFQHANAGGQIEELFLPGEKDYSKITINDEDEEHARQVVEDYWKKKGITDKNKLRKLVQTEEDSEEGIVATGRSYLKELTDDQEVTRAERLEIAQRAEAKRRESDQELLQGVEETIKSGQLGTFVVPKKDAVPFYDFVSKRIQRSGDNKYIIYSELEGSQLNDQLKYEYYKFKKGDLGKLIEAKAKTENVKRLKTTVAASKKKPSGTTAAPKRKSVSSMKDFEQD